MAAEKASSSPLGCPFCRLSAPVFEEGTILAIPDKFPVSPGHLLLLTRRHVGTWWDLTDDEQRDLHRALHRARSVLEKERRPDGFNIGHNAGAAAGQTVPHFHVHVIPRYQGDVADPRGGVRHVIPSKGNYLAAEADRERR